MQVAWQPVIALCLGIVFLALGIAAVIEKQRFTPVYEDVVCKPTSTGIGSVQMSPLQATVTVDIVCRNPNPYEFTVHPAGAGRALLGAAQQDVGSVTATKTIVPAAVGDEVALGTLVMNVQVTLGLWETITLMASMLQGPITIFFDLKLAVMIEPVMLGLSAGMVEIPVQQHCGMQIQVLPSQDSGECVCSDASYDDLVVPSITESSTDDLGISPDVSDETIQGAESARDTFCVTVATVSILLALALISSSFYCFSREILRRRRQEVKTLGKEAPGAPPVVVGQAVE